MYPVRKVGRITSLLPEAVRVLSKHSKSIDCIFQGGRSRRGRQQTNICKMMQAICEHRQQRSCRATSEVPFERRSLWTQAWVKKGEPSEVLGVRCQAHEAAKRPVAWEKGRSGGTR